MIFSLHGKNCIYARIPGTIIQNYPAGAVGSERLGCSKYNCTDKGSLLIDLIGVISGGCCQCFVSVGIHSCASLLLPEGRERKYAVISHLQSVEVAEFKLDIFKFLHHGGQTAKSRKKENKCLKITRWKSFGEWLGQWEFNQERPQRKLQVIAFNFRSIQLVQWESKYESFSWNMLFVEEDNCHPLNQSLF